MVTDAINMLAAIGDDLERLVKQIDELRGRGSGSGTALEATGVAGLGVHVATARDELSAAADKVDRDLGQLVRRSMVRGEC